MYTIELIDDIREKLFRLADALLVPVHDVCQR